MPPSPIFQNNRTPIHPLQQQTFDRIHRQQQRTTRGGAKQPFPFTAQDTDHQTCFSDVAAHVQRPTTRCSKVRPGNMSTLKTRTRSVTPLSRYKIHTTKSSSSILGHIQRPTTCSTATPVPATYIPHNSAQQEGRKHHITVHETHPFCFSGYMYTRFNVQLPATPKPPSRQLKYR